MCRIAGILSGKQDAAHTRAQVQGMCDSLKHGGPDDEGIYINPKGDVCLGHRRLAILDLSRAGHQPMSNCQPDQPVGGEGYLWISFNGEIYNFKEIREELIAKGVTFRTQTDTEVILKAYQAWGTESFKMLRGMFAFALADLAENKTYLVRDPSGIKPLYYSIHQEQLIFSSEVKAFDASGYSFAKDPNWKIYFLAFGHIPEPHTTLVGVKHLEKGHFMVWDHQKRSAKIVRFNAFRFTNEIYNRKEAIELVREKLTGAVKRHLISDAPIGVFLSGGIDSSILTLVANQFERKNLKTLSINLQETDYAERRYQSLVTEKTEGSHNEYMVTYRDFITYFEKIFSCMDQPSNDGINSWFVCKSARENGLKAVLSGLGGDEFFGGYPSFNRMGAISLLKKIPRPLLRLTKSRVQARFKRLYYLSYDNPIGEYLFLRGYFTPDVIASLLDTDVRQVNETLSGIELGRDIETLKGSNRASWLETNLYMQNQLLRDSDYMSMSHGLEVRVPFLDQDLINAVYSIDPKTKFQSTIPKKLLIDAFSDILPEQIWNRKKMGFSFPFQEWMRRFETISNVSQYKNKTSRQLMQDFRDGKLHWSNAFAIYHVAQAA